MTRPHAAGGILLVVLWSATGSAGEVEVKQTHLCCSQCVEHATNALKAINGVSDIACNREAKTIKFHAADAIAAKAGFHALAKAGFHGEAAHAGKAVAPPPSGAEKGDKADRIVLAGMHLCCGACQRTVRTALGDAAIPGVEAHAVDREQGTVTVEGAGFDVTAVVSALNEAGFHATLEQRRKSKFNRVVAVGDRAPDWRDLVGTDDRHHALEDYRDAKVVVVVFISNHCPVATDYEDRLVQFASDYKDKGVQLVAINVSRLPSDRLEAMKSRADEKGFNFPYLYDASQDVGLRYGALVTPQVFVLDAQRRIAYMGAIDDSQNPARVTKPLLRDAVAALLAGREPEVAESRQFGCEIQYENRATDPAP